METTADLLMLAARGLRRRYLEAMAPWDVTPGQFRALRTICGSGPIRLSALADSLGIAPRSATEVVDALQQRGLVERVPDPADRRAIGVVPTPAGREAERAIESARAEEAEAYLAELTDGDRADLERILRQVAGDLQNAVPAGPAR